MCKACEPAPEVSEVEDSGPVTRRPSKVTSVPLAVKESLTVSVPAPPSVPPYRNRLLIDESDAPMSMRAVSEMLSLPCPANAPKRLAWPLPDTLSVPPKFVVPKTVSVPVFPPAVITDTVP